MWNYLHNTLNRKQLAELHSLTREKVVFELNQTNRSGSLVRLNAPSSEDRREAKYLVGEAFKVVGRSLRVIMSLVKRYSQTLLKNVDL